MLKNIIKSKLFKNSEKFFLPNIIDLSIYNDNNVDKNGRKTHFFSNSKINLDLPNFDESSVFIKLERNLHETLLELLK